MRSCVDRGGSGGDLTTSYDEESAAHRLFTREGRGFDSAGLERRAMELKGRLLIINNENYCGGKGRSGTGGRGGRGQGNSLDNTRIDHDDKRGIGSSSPPLATLRRRICGLSPRVGTEVR